jgi:Uma2 family endonuclease
MTVEAFPDWLRPPPGGFVAEDLDRLPDLPPHTELIDGGLVFVSPQRAFHSLIISLLELCLRAQAPAGLKARREMTITLARHQRPEPDLIVIDQTQDTGMDATGYAADGVCLVVEVVSPESAIRDRERKPQLYAQAGIAHFWRIEDAAGRAVVYVYELDPATKAYALTGIHHERLTLAVPFAIDIDLTEIERF